MIPNPFIKPSDDLFEPNRRLIIKKHFDVKKIKRIVVRGIDPLGDVAIGSAFFREVRRLFPDAFIVVILSSHAAQWMEHCPYVDEVRVFSKKQQWKMVRVLRREKYDLALLLTGNLRSALMAYFAGIPNRVGFDTDGRGSLLTVRLSMELHNRYRGENHFDLLRAIGLQPENVFARECWIGEKERAEAADIFARHGLHQDQELFAFNPFSRIAIRQWDNKNWTDLLSKIQQQGIQPVMFVGPGEAQEGQALSRKWGFDKIPVIEEHLLLTVAMLEKFRWVVGVDSGFIHMALAVNMPHVIAIFGLLPTNSSFPVNDFRHKSLIKSTLPCAPCYLYKRSDRCFNDVKCMKELTAEDVLLAMGELAAK
jgi:lipopolysaccharide heptosyltransferase II